MTMSPMFSKAHAEALVSRAEYESLQGNFVEAEKLYREALPHLENVLGKTNVDIAVLLHGLSRSLEAQGKIVEASELRERARVILLYL